MTLIAHHALYLLLGLAFSWLGTELQSTFLTSFLSSSLLVLQVALLAINTTARTALLSKLRELGSDSKIKFQNTAKAMNSALVEQIVLIALTALILILYFSMQIASVPLMKLLTEAALIGMLIASIQIVYDTAKAIMLILEDQLK